MRSVLIVEDDEDARVLGRMVLECGGFAVTTATNGAEALRSVQRAPPCVILLDLMMPVMDGMATMQAIRKLPAGKNLPIIAVTAKAMKGDREKCIEAGAWDYLSKPVNTEDLLAVLRAWLPQ